jgi:hypothetical protein
MVMFDKDGEWHYQPWLHSVDGWLTLSYSTIETVYPKESAIFGSLAPETHELIRMEEHDFLYKEDHIGLKTLQDLGRTLVVQCTGAHMELEWKDENGCAKQLVKTFVGKRSWSRLHRCLERHNVDIQVKQGRSVLVRVVDNTDRK